MKEKYPQTIYFSVGKGNKFKVQLNGFYADYDVLIACKNALVRFTKYLTRADIDEYNQVIAREIRKHSEDKNLLTRTVTVPGWIYIYKSQGLYKIGRSRSSDCREKKYVTENPHPIELVVKFQTNNCVRKETEIHSLFANKRYRGEWFKLNNKDIEFIKKTYA